MLTPTTVLAAIVGAALVCFGLWAAAVADRIRHGLARRRAQPLVDATEAWDEVRAAPRPRARRRRPAPRAARAPRPEPVAPPVADRDDVRDWLQGMGYSREQAADAADRARRALPHAAVDRQIREALRFMPVEN